MDTNKIELSRIRPFVRLAVKIRNMYHTREMLPLEHRLVCIEEGEAEFKVAGETYHVSANSLFLIRAGIPYQFKSLGDTSTIWVCFDLTMENIEKRERRFPVPPEESVNVEDKLLCPYRLVHEGREVSVLQMSAAGSVVALVERMLDHYGSHVGGNYRDYVISGMMVSVISMIFSLQESKRKWRASKQVAELAVEYVHKNYNRKISLDEIADAIRFHRSYVNRCFRKEIGVSIHQYLMEYRLEKAMQLLVYTGLSVEEIAERTGFSGSKGFALSFKKKYGLPPSHVRK